jgi:pilus assembly protein CpaF
MGLLDRVKKADEEKEDADEVLDTVAVDLPAFYDKSSSVSNLADSSPIERKSRLITRIGSAGITRTSGVQEIKLKVHRRLLAEYADSVDASDRAEIASLVSQLVDEEIAASDVIVSRQERLKIVETILDDVLGLGPLEPLLKDETITEIMVNNPKQVYVERYGRIEKVDVSFEDTHHLMMVIDRIVSTVGRRVDESSPMCDARLPDGSRVNVIIPPLAIKGPCMTIRKFGRKRLTMPELIKLGTLSEAMAKFLAAAVRAKVNLMVSGGTGSGKTTTLNVLSGFIPSWERIITCEDAAELQLNQEHVVTLEARPPNIEGKGMVPIRDLVINSLRMRPDRIIVGECRGGEALDMLQAMNTGHEGSMTTIHANSPRDAMSRLETMVLMAGTELPSRAIRDQIASAIDIVIHQDRMRDGKRRIVNISELTGIIDGQIEMHDIFVYKQVGVKESGEVVGYHTATGYVPKVLEKILVSGEHIDKSIFEPSEAPEDVSRFIDLLGEG